MVVVVIADDVRGATICLPGQKAEGDDREYGYVAVRGDHRTSNASKKAQSSGFTEVRTAYRGDKL